MAAKLYVALDEIRVGNVLFISPDGITLRVAKSWDLCPIGLALRDIPQGESISYDPCKNTQDVAVFRPGWSHNRTVGMRVDLKLEAG